MTWTARFAAGLIALSPLAAEARTERVSFSCDVEGQPARMVAQIEYIGRSGITADGRGNITGVIGTGETGVYMTGRIDSVLGSYQFSGENQFADFWGNGARFRVKWVQDRGGVWMIVNPFDRSTQRRYFCRVTGRR